MDRLIHRTPAHSASTITSLLERMEQRASLPTVLAPDFEHGTMRLSDAYAQLETLGGSADLRCLIVIDDEGLTLARFEDHFLSMHTFQDSRHEPMERFLNHILPKATIIHLLDLRSQPHAWRPSIPSHAQLATRAHMHHAQLIHAERELLHITREEEAITNASQRRQNDLLSLLGLLTAPRHATSEPVRVAA